MCQVPEPCSPRSSTHGVLSLRGFSLVELLIVIGVLGLLVALTAPMLSGTGASQKLRAASDSISSMAAIARQNSVGQNVLSALVVLKSSAPAEKALRSIAIFELRQNPEGTPAVSSDWKQITPWKDLPSGVLIDPTASSFLTSSSIAPHPPFPASVVVAGQSTASFAYQIFQPNGRLMNPDTVVLKVVPAVLHNGEIQITGPQSGSGPANYLTIAFLASTGRNKIFQP